MTVADKPRGWLARRLRGNAVTVWRLVALDFTARAVWPRLLLDWAAGLANVSTGARKKFCRRRSRASPTSRRG